MLMYANVTVRLSCSECSCAGRHILQISVLHTLVFILHSYHASLHSLNRHLKVETTAGSIRYEQPAQLSNEVQNP